MNIIKFLGFIDRSFQLSKNEQKTTIRNPLFGKFYGNQNTI